MARKTSSVKPRRLRLGLYGGTFDPVHLGHLLLARDALEQRRLDAVLFVPCARSPFKTKRPLTSDSRRVAMLKLALKSEPRFWLSRCELDRPAPSYAIDTVEEIAEGFPRAELFWLIGEDQLAKLDEWRRIAELRRRATFLLLPRGGGKGMAAATRPPAGVLGLPRPRRVDISASEIRSRIQSCQPITHLVPASVAAYIQRHGLYRS